MFLNASFFAITELAGDSAIVSDHLSMLQQYLELYSPTLLQINSLGRLTAEGHHSAQLY